MAAADAQGNGGRDRLRRTVLLSLLALLLVCVCLALTAQLAVWPRGLWEVGAGMLSEINPNEVVGTPGLYVQPLRPEVMTPPPWMPYFLTPQGSPYPSPFGTVPTGTAIAEAPTGTPTPSPTPTRTPTATPTSTSTSTPTATPSATPTSTSTPSPTNTPVPPPPPPPPPSPTALPPVVLAIAPDTAVNTAAVGVTITGLNFQAGCSASLGAWSLTVSGCTPTAASASVPVNIVAGYYDLTVTNPDSQSGTLTNAYTATNPVPVLTAVTPMTWFNTLDVVVTITGANFRNTGAPGNLRAYLDGTTLSSVTYISPTMLTATVPSASGPMALGVYTVTVTNPGPTGPTGSLVNAFAIDTYTTTVTCSGALVGSCSDAGGPPDGAFVGIQATGVITVDFGVGQGITLGPGYDMVYYERSNGPGIFLDYITVEISSDGITWYTVFEWNGDPGGSTDVSGTNIDGYASDADGELENEGIPAIDLYPFPGTGIAIDLNAVASPPPVGNYHLVRFSYPGGGLDVGEIDAVQSLH